MANLQTSVLTEAQSMDETTPRAVENHRFDQMYRHLSETMDIVDPQSNDHRFNLYEDLRTRLQGTVTVLGEIVKSDPELWSDDR